MTAIRVKWADDNLKKFGKRLDELNRRFPKVLPQIINQVGNRAKTQVVRNLTAQTGLQRRVIVKAIGDPIRARPGSYRYIMSTSGGNIRLKYFKPSEKRAGVVAKPFGKRTLFAKAFMKGGRFPNRKDVPAFKGHVYRRLGYGMRTDGSKGVKLTQVRSGVFIPKEMTEGRTAKAFVTIAGPLLQSRVEAVLRRLGI